MNPTPLKACIPSRQPMQHPHRPRRPDGRERGPLCASAALWCPVGTHRSIIAQVAASQERQLAPPEQFRLDAGMPSAMANRREVARRFHRDCNACTVSFTVIHLTPRKENAEMCQPACTSHPLSEGELPQAEIYTDGGCEPNPGPGGWSAIIRVGRCEWVLAGNDPDRYAVESGKTGRR